MLTHTSSVLICLLTAILVTPRPLHAQPARDTLVIRGGQVGTIVAGIGIDSLYRLVPRARATLVDRRGEGLFDPVIEIRRSAADRQPSLVVEVQSSRCGHVVGRVTVFDPRYRTADGLHVGSTLGEVRRRLPVTVSREEGLHAISTSPAFRFDIAGELPGDSVVSITVQAPVDPCAIRR